MHRVGRAEIELEVRDVGLAESLLDRIGALHGPRIAPALERVFDELSGPDRLDRIDRLDLDLGLVALDAFDDAFIRELEAALRAALTKVLGERRSGDRARGSLELLATYARTGNLPWHADLAARDPVATALAALVGEEPRAMLGLLRELQDDPLALARLARHCDDPSLAALVETRCPAEGAELLARARAQAEGAQATGAARVRQMVLAALADADPPAHLLRALRPEPVAAAHDAPRAPAPPPDADLAHDNVSKDMLFSTETGEHVDGGEARVLSSASAGEPPGARAPGRESRPADRPSLRLEVRPRPDLDALQVARRRALASLDELHVEDAGLVLLWPFLERFFARAALLDDERRFVDEQANMRAVALLELLAAADPDPPEFRLPLAKLLCGLSPEVGFALERPLAPAQAAECEHLLAAVIAHAPILRDMQPASFRAAFLRRPAVLGTRDGAWLLQVERRPHDAVLERFPWSWAWVKLPWMTDPLQVEW